LDFTDAEKPSFGQGTLVAVPLLEKGPDSSLEWSAILEAAEGNYIRVLVITKADSLFL